MARQPVMLSNFVAVSTSIHTRSSGTGHLHDRQRKTQRRRGGSFPLDPHMLRVETGSALRARPDDDTAIPQVEAAQVNPGGNAVRRRVPARHLERAETSFVRPGAGKNPAAGAVV